MDVGNYKPRSTTAEGKRKLINTVGTSLQLGSRWTNLSESPNCKLLQVDLKKIKIYKIYKALAQPAGKDK